MSPVMHSAQLFLLAFVLFLALGSLATAALSRALKPRIAGWEPRTRHRALVVLASLPVLTSLVLLLATSLPSLIALAIPELDHCPEHDDGHAHLCFMHLPEFGASLVPLLGLVFTFSYAFVRGAFSAAGLVKATRIVNALAKTAERRTDLGIAVIETTQPVCLAAGLLRPRVLLSRGLLEALNAEELAVVLAHERAHVRRRDALVASIVRALAVVHLPAVARWLLSELEIAAEQACDEEAARCVGDRVAVASAILTVERTAQHAATSELCAVAVAFGKCAVARRVESLLAEPKEPASLRPFAIGLGVTAVSLFALADELHHATESLLSFIAH